MGDSDCCIPIGYDKLAEPVTVFWYEHDCEWISKYCEEHHRRAGTVARIVLETVVKTSHSASSGELSEP